MPEIDADERLDCGGPFDARQWAMHGLLWAYYARERRDPEVRVRLLLARVALCPSPGREPGVGSDRAPCRPDPSRERERAIPGGTGVPSGAGIPARETAIPDGTGVPASDPASFPQSQALRSPSSLRRGPSLPLRVLTLPRRWILGGSLAAGAIAAALLTAILVPPELALRAALARGLDAEAEQRHEDTLTAAEEMLRIDPQSRAAWLLKARAFFWEYRLEEAQATLAPLLASDPDDSLLNLHMAAFLRRTDPERAAEFERRALAQFPEEAEAWYLRGLLAGRAGEGVEPIKVEAYSKALALNPRHFRSRNYRAWAFFELGRFEDMLADGRQGVVLRPERANAWDTVAVALNRLGRYEEAVPYFTRAIELAPQLAQYYNNRAYNFVWLKQYERALADCAAALRLDPEYWAAYWWQGVAYRFLEQPGLAVEPFQRVAALLAEREPANVYHALAVLHLLIVLRESGRPTEAEPWLADATMQDADFDAWGRQLLAYCRGTVASDELLARAGDDARRISQAYCFIAERALADGQVARARDLFSRCLSAGDRRSLDCQLAAWRLAQGPVTPDGGGQ